MQRGRDEEHQGVQQGIWGARGGAYLGHAVGFLGAEQGQRGGTAMGAKRDPWGKVGATEGWVMGCTECCGGDGGVI